MKLFVFLAALMILIPCSLQSDTFDFDLRTFSPPDYTRTSLEFSSSFSTNLSTQELTDLMSLYTENALGSFYDSDIKGTYSYYRYSKERISDMTISLLYGYVNNYEKREDYVLTDRADTSIGVSLQREEKLYMFNNYFVTIGAGTMYEFEKTYSPENSDRMGRRYLLDGSFGFGWGRLVNVGYARTALFMYEDMQKYSVLQSAPTADDIRELATLIAQRKNVRSLDYRDTFVENIKTFDQFFKGKSNVTNDISCMAAYTDVFHNLTQVNRFNGSRLELDFRTRYANIRMEEYDIMTESSLETQTGFMATINYDYENPLSQQWQLSFDYSSRYIKENRDLEMMDTTINTLSTNGVMHDIELTLGYYPTQRTSFTASSALMYQSLEAELEHFDADMREATMKAFGIMIDCGLHYYFSPNIRMSASVDTMYVYQQMTTTTNSHYDEQTQKGYNTSLDLGITYILF